MACLPLLQTLVNEELKQYFRPEFLNRLDEIIVFRQLTKAEVKEIADIMLKEVRAPRRCLSTVSVMHHVCKQFASPGFSGHALSLRCSHGLPTT